jgi:hypothetical protein
MYYISQPSGFSLEEHINFLEDLYAECLKDNIEARTLTDIWHQINGLQEKLSRLKGLIPL